ncbi:MAG TPA: hypothetical protein PKZ00_07080, partial [Elusimicrobiota bacterium]|nr:hypothetical protein [Elusimicrobiota bacterium]
MNRRYEPPTPPDLKLHVLSDFHVDDIYKYLNPVMLYGKHLGLRGTLVSLGSALVITAVAGGVLVLAEDRPAERWAFAGLAVLAAGGLAWRTS